METYFIIVYVIVEEVIRILKIKMIRSPSCLTLKI
jgi:hypothetical protein